MKTEKSLKKDWKILRNIKIILLSLYSQRNKMKKVIAILSTIFLFSCAGKKEITIGQYRYFGGNQYKIEQRKAFKQHQDSLKLSTLK